MTYLVAFDGGDLSASALRRARGFADRTDRRLAVVSVVPTDEALAETYGLPEADDEPYDPGAAEERLRRAVEDLAPGASFRAETVDAYAGKRRIAKRISRAAREEAADVVFLGSDDPGRVVRPLTRVDDLDYDVFVVRSG